MDLHVALAGGGTAGHVNPLLATAHAVRARGGRVTAIGTEQGLETTLVPADGFTLEFVPKVPVPRRPTPELLSLPTRLKGAVDRALEILEGVDVLVGFGGYVSAPAYIAAKRAGIPFIVQEQNVRPGWANKLGARNAAAVSLTFPETELRARVGITKLTGMPLRRAIMELAEQRKTAEGRLAAREVGARIFGLDPSLPTLLVTGGSLGAQHLNEVITQSSTRIRHGIQILHVTGKGKSAEVIAAAANPKVKYKWEVVEYLGNMDQAMAAADLVLCRSGAGTVSELEALGLPAFYVPLPIGNGEQKLNAAAQVHAGGALLVEDKYFTVATLEQTVIPLLVDSERLERMGEASRSVSPGDGAQLLVDLIEMVA